VTRVVAVYGGGGAKAAAHLGAERALREAGLRPAAYVGCSFGAVVAAALALGMEAEAVETKLVELGRKKIAVVDPLIAILGIRRPALLKQEPLRAAFTQLFGRASFADLKCPLAVAVTDLDCGDLLLYGTGGRDAPLIDVLLATCALPLYYAPVALDGRRCIDGGIRAVLPLEEAMTFGPERVVAIDVGPGFDEGPPAPGGTPLPQLIANNQNSLGISMAQGTLDRLGLWRMTPGRPPLTYVRPRVERNATFAIDRIQAYVAEGYRATKSAIGHQPSAI
jgi:NTE family protein